MFCSIAAGTEIQADFAAVPEFKIAAIFCNTRHPDYQLGHSYLRETELVADMYELFLHKMLAPVEDKPYAKSY